MIHLKLLKPDSGQSGSIKMGTFTHCACAQAKHEQIVKLWGKISLQTDVNFTIFIYGMYTLYSRVRDEYKCRLCFGVFKCCHMPKVYFSNA